MDSLPKCINTLVEKNDAGTALDFNIFKILIIFYGLDFFSLFLHYYRGPMINLRVNYYFGKYVNKCRFFF